MDSSAVLKRLFEAALNAADPHDAVRRHLSDRPSGRVVIVGAGKGSARMAQAVEAQWGPCEGLIIVPHGGRLATAEIEIVEAGHPVPDRAGENAARRILEMLSGLGKEDLALCLISGGGSALMALPGKGLSLADKQAVNSALLSSGAAISEMNTVRKHLSAIKGGRLAVAAHPANIRTLIISDVPGDDPSVIASGPTVPDRSQTRDAMEIVTRYGLVLPQHVLKFLEGDDAETPASDHPAFALSSTQLVAAPQMAMEAAACAAQAAGFDAVILGDAIEGEAREVGTVMAGIARQVVRHGQPAKAPLALISGGETTVSLKGAAGKGGRCSEFLLGFALASWDLQGVSALACDTDGRDGSQHNAGAIWTEIQRARADRRKALEHLARHDAYSFFEHVGGLVETGPTHTNVNDFRVVLVHGSASG